MKKFHLVEILCAAGLFMVMGCENFLSGSEIKEELQKSINEANAAEVQIFISADADTGSVAPNGTVTYKVGKSFPVVFTESKGYQFSHWEIIDRETKRPIENAITVANSGVAETSVLVLADVKNIYLHPVCIVRPSVERISPQYADAGVPRDSAIVITFNKIISKDNDFSKIQITSGGNSVKDCYKAPVVNNNLLQFDANPSNLIDASSGTRNVTVTIPEDFFYIEDKTVVTLGSEYSYSFRVNNTTNEKTRISFDAAGRGKIIPSEEHEYSIGESFTLKFEPGNGYNFNGWNVLDGDGKDADGTILKFSDKMAASTTVTVLSKANITITPNSEMIPAVESMSPEYKEEGVICFKPILITFNMPMAASDLDGTFANVKIQNANGYDIKEYFQLPKLSSDGKRLTIKPKIETIKSLLSSSRTADITVSLANTIHQNGGSGLCMNTYENKYKINDSSDTTEPVITSLKVYSDASQTRLLSSKNVDEWDIPSDVNSNQIGGKVWIRCQGIDADSGVKAIVVKEELVKLPNGNTPGSEYKQGNSKEYGSFTEYELNNYESDLIEYPVRTTIDGVAKLSVYLVDAEGKQSLSSEDCYVVIHNTFTNSGKIVFGDKDQTANCKALRFADGNGRDKAYLTKVSGLKDQIYKGAYNPLNVKIEYWDEGNVHTSLYAENNFESANGEIDLSDKTKYFIDRNAEKITNVLLAVSDNFGHEYSFEYQIPRNSSVGCMTTVQPYNKDSRWKIIANDISDEKYKGSIKYYAYYKKHSEPVSEYKYLADGNYSYSVWANGILQNENQYDVVISTSWKDTNGVTTYGCIKQGEIQTFKYNNTNHDHSYDLYTTPGWSKPTIQWPTVDVDWDVDIHKSSGTLKGKATLGFNSKNGITYKLCFDSASGIDNGLVSNPDSSSGDYYFPKNLDEFYLQSSKKYSIKVAAISPSGGKIAEYCFGPADLTIAKYDTEPPYLNTFQTYSRPDGMEFQLSEGGMKDENPSKHTAPGVGMKNSVTYSVTENSLTNPYSAIVLTDSVEFNYSKNLPDYTSEANKYTNYYIHLPVNSGTNSYYSMYVRFSDKNGNYATEPGKVVSTTVMDKKPKITKSGSILKFEADGKIQSDLISVISTSGTSWKDYLTSGLPYSGTYNGDNENYSTFNFSNTSYNSTFVRIYHHDGVTTGSGRGRKFYKTSYVYPKYYNSTVTIDNKNVLELPMGYQIYNDSTNPVLIQVLYNESNLGEDADLWATKGLEASVCCKNGGFTYNIPESTVRYNVPSNNYYCAVLHFVDGTTYMTKVQYK